MSEANISVADSQELLALLGPRDQHLRAIRDSLGVRIFASEGAIHVEGGEQEVGRAADVFRRLKALADRGGGIDASDVAQALANVSGPDAGESPTIDVMQVGRRIQARGPGQQAYIRAIAEHDVVLAIGPAGTGKTYLAVAMAVQALKQERIRKIVLVRPAVEAGESLGYLPGDLHAKINPYLRPLLDALREMMDYDQIKRYMEQDLIEVIPLAYMRGRTLNDAFIILDEAQNATVSQMKMFLTRMGRGAKIVASGDPTQIDLPSPGSSGLNDALHRLRRVEGIAVVELTGADIVRHRLVSAIVRAYDEAPASRRSS